MKRETRPNEPDVPESCSSDIRVVCLYQSVQHVGAPLINRLTFRGRRGVDAFALR